VTVTRIKRLLEDNLSPMQIVQAMILEAGLHRLVNLGSWQRATLENSIANMIVLVHQVRDEILLTEGQQSQEIFVKTEREIRRHRDNLREAMRKPCGCAGTKHEEKCIRGAYMLRSAERTLSWILREAPEMQDLVDRMERELHVDGRSN
jgi:hypothetical protein